MAEIANTTSRSNVPACLNATSGASRQAHTGEENMACLWTTCGQKFANAHMLYEHVCERHIGRKDTNNLNLICGWGDCTTTTAKRDQLTSHILVHVPVRPHKCEFCGKSFKRTQDLRKHVQTHADHSVLSRHEVAEGGRLNEIRAPKGTSHFGYGAQNRGVGELVSQPTGASGTCGPQLPPDRALYYSQSPWNSQHSEHVGYYTAVPDGYDQHSPLEAMDNFPDRANNHQIDPTSYAQIDRSLVSLRNFTTIPNGAVTPTGQQMSQHPPAPAILHPGPPPSTSRPFKEHTTSRSSNRAAGGPDRV